jgi:hypothetical protein
VQNIWDLLVSFGFVPYVLWSRKIVVGCFMVRLDLEVWSVAWNLCSWWLMEDENKYKE